MERLSTQVNLLNGIDSRRKFTAEDEITEINRSKSVLYAILSQFGKKRVTDPDHKYQEHDNMHINNHYFNIAGGVTCIGEEAGHAYSEVDLTLPTGVSALFTVGGNDRYIVRALHATDKTKSITFLAKPGTTALKTVLVLITHEPTWDVPASITKFHIVGTAHKEGGAKTEAYYDTVAQVWASCQIFKTLVKVSRTVQNLTVAGGNEYERLLDKSAGDHKMDIARGVYYGERETVIADGVAGNPFGSPPASHVVDDARTTMGLRQACIYSGNVFSVDASTYTYSDLIDDMETQFEVGNMDKLAFVGAGVLSFFNKMASSEAMLTMTAGETVFGIKVNQLITIHGTLMLIRDELLRGEFKNDMFVIDQEYVEMMTYEDTTFEVHVETPGTDGREDQWMSDTGLIVKNTKAHGYWVIDQ